MNKNASLLQQLDWIYKWVNNAEVADNENPNVLNNYTIRTVLPDTTNKLFGKRRQSQNMKMLMGGSLNLSTDRGNNIVFVFEFK